MNGFTRGGRAAGSQRANPISRNTADSLARLRRRWRMALGGVLLAGTGFLPGCGFARPPVSAETQADPQYYATAATRVDFPDAQTPVNEEVLQTAPPITIADESEIDFEFVSLQEVVHTALQNSRVLRDLGGTVLRSPDSVDTTYDVALQELHPRFGVAAALSEFDASFAASAFVDKNDRLLNNQFFGGGTRSLKQDFSTIESQLTKRAATGTELTLRNHTEYDSNNAPGNQFYSAWTNWLDAEVRHPLLQGGGTEFNRIAGPSGTTSNINGVVLARLRTDVTLAEFEGSVRNFVSNVENAYWDLYFSYRDLDARIVARDTALQTWNRINALYQAGRVGGEAEKEAQAREQYFRFQEQVQNALSGRLEESTRTNNGAAGGSFRAIGGVMTAERRLRLLMGLPVNGKTLLRPGDEPIAAQVSFNWDSILVESLTRRVELRRQKWIIKQREQEHLASRNFLLPQLDLVGRYRWRGFGKDLLPYNDRTGATASAVENMTLGDYQEWHLGAEFSIPLGNRRANAAVEYAEMQLARERAILAEQEREVVHALSTAVAELNRSWAVLETSEDRRLAAAEQLDSVQAAFEADKVAFDVLLEAQRRYLEAETNYYRSLVEYTLAVRNVHFEKGSLLDYNEIYLTEDIWPEQAYAEAAERRHRTLPGEWLHGLMTAPSAVSAGPYNQNMQPGDAEEWENGSTLATPLTESPEEPPVEGSVPGAPAGEPGSKAPYEEPKSPAPPPPEAGQEVKQTAFRPEEDDQQPEAADGPAMSADEFFEGGEGADGPGPEDLLMDDPLQ